MPETEKTLYPSDLIESLRVCEQTVEDATISDAQTYEEKAEFGDWVDSIFQVFIDVVWHSFFKRWLQCLAGFFKNHELHSLLFEIKRVYDQAAMEMKFKILEEGKISLWVLPNKRFEIKFGGTSVSYQLSKEDFQSVMEELSKTLQRNSEICVSMFVKQREMLEHFQRINSLEYYQAVCFNRVVERFVQTLVDLRMTLADKFAVIDKLTEGSDSSSLHFRFTVMKTDSVKIVLEGNRLYVFGIGDDPNFVQTFNVHEKEDCLRLADALDEKISEVYFHLPTTEKMLCQTLRDLNPKESIQSQLRPSVQDEQAAPLPATDLPRPVFDPKS